MTPCWLLDTSALLALRDDEVGAERVAGLLQAAQPGVDRLIRPRCHGLRPQSSNSLLDIPPPDQPLHIHAFAGALAPRHRQTLALDDATTEVAEALEIRVLAGG